MKIVASVGSKLTVFHEVYNPRSLSKIAERAKNDKGLSVLNGILKGENDFLKIARLHLDKCLCFAKENGGLDADRIERLANPLNFHSWKAVYNELLVAYFFAKRFRGTIRFISNPKEKGLGDFHIDTTKGAIVVEVKTPKGDDPNMQGPKGVHHGFDEHLLRTTFLDGARQLKKGNRNLIVICTQLCVWIHDSMPFEKLLYGTYKLVSIWDPNSRDRKPPKNIFEPNGELNKYKSKRRTRISATASFTEDSIGTGKIGRYIKTVKFTVFHNYYASLSINPRIFSGTEQFIPNKRQKRLDHVRKNKAYITLPFGNTVFLDFVLNVYNSIYKHFRKVRCFYWSLRMHFWKTME